MAIRIRRKSAPAPALGDDDVTSRLAECHVRIRRFLEEAATLARTSGAEAPRRASARDVRRYFAQALPLHAEDEDHSIAPRLPAEHAALVARLSAEHDAIVDGLRHLEADWARWAEGAAGPGSPAHLDLLSRTSAALHGHLALEEIELFPAIRRLDARARRDIVAEMGARRGASTAPAVDDPGAPEP